MNYDKILVEWAKKLYEKIDKCSDILDNLNENEVGTYRHGYLRGYSDGLAMAMAILCRLEKKEIRRNKNNG